VLAEGRPVATTDASLDTWLGERASVLTGGIRGLVCLPLAVGDELLGVLYADSRRPGATVTELDVEILSALADHAALVLSLAEVRRELDALEREAEPAPPPEPPSPGRSWRQLVARSEGAPT
jgi:GAF domain-containing protein